MGSPYTSVSVNSYNANPPPDDGTEVTANRITWSSIKTKLADTLKTAIESINTNIGTALGKIPGGAGVVSTATDYSVTTSDQGKLVVVTASATITTPDAATVGSPFFFGIVNRHTGNITLDGNGSQTIDGSDSIVVPPGKGLLLETDGSNWLTFGQNFDRGKPVLSGFKNLSIKVATNTTVTVAADYVTMYNSAGNPITLAISGTIDMGSNGAVNKLDTGTIAAATWYAIWAIAKEDGTAGALASTSGSSPTLPSGYTYKARIGWVRTAAGVAQLHGTWQYGNRAQYKVGLAQTSLPRVMATTTSTLGNPSTGPFVTFSISDYVPTTAAIIHIGVRTPFQGTTIVMPNGSYGGIGDSTTPPFVGFVNNDDSVIFQSASMLIEGTTLSWSTQAGTSGSNVVVCHGWEDNI